MPDAVMPFSLVQRPVFDPIDFTDDACYRRKGPQAHDFAQHHDGERQRLVSRCNAAPFRNLEQLQIGAVTGCGTGEGTVNKSQLIEKLALLTNQTNKVAESSVNIFFSNIKQALANGDKVEIRGFGSFLLKSYNAYTGRNPKTGERVFVPKKELPFFRAGKDLRERVNGGPVEHASEQSRSSPPLAKVESDN
jgi:integration host factor subunit beta